MSKVLKVIVTLVLSSFALLNLTSLTANASTYPATRWDKGASSGFSWVVENYAAEADVANFVKWFTPGVKLLDVIAEPGATLNLKWKVTDPSGKALANTKVTLVLNPAYTLGIAKSKTGDGTLIPTAGGGERDGLDVQLTTDANGEINYQIINTNTAADGDEGIPNDNKATPPGNSTLYNQAVLYVGAFKSASERSFAQTSQDVDIIEIHYMNGVAGAVKAPEELVIPSSAPVNANINFHPSKSTGLDWVNNNKEISDDTTNFLAFHTPSSKLINAFAKAGSSPTLTWLVTDKDAKPLANTDVTLIANPAYSNGVAKTADARGNIIPNVAGGTSDGALIPLKTDANGLVSYKVTNLDESATAESFSTNQNDAPQGNTFTQFKLYVGNFPTTLSRSVPANQAVQLIQNEDVVDLHFLKALTQNIVTKSIFIEKDYPAVIEPVVKSKPNAVATNVAPTNSSEPTITGALKNNSVATGKVGIWNGKNISYSVQWLSCSKPGAAVNSIPSGCAAISNASSKTFKITTTAKIKYLRFAVAAQNNLGSNISTSAAVKIG